jgi:hypothetical protein
MASTVEALSAESKENIMRATKTILSLAIASLFAAGGAALAYGPGPHGGMGLWGPRAGAPVDQAARTESLQAGLDRLKEALKLQPQQKQAWDAYEAKAKAEAQVRAEMRQSMLGQRGDAQAMADHRVTMMKHNAQAAEEINTLRKALVATLTAEQKAIFDDYMSGPRFAHGAGDGTQRGFGPGYGPGRSGRGPGFGPGCAGAV